MKASRSEAANALLILHHFIGPRQLAAIAEAMGGEERQFFYDKLAELASITKEMPGPLETDGQDGDAIVFLHYFLPHGDFWIIERDTYGEQRQAFGLADMGHAELGYVSIHSLLAAGAELDLYWTPKPLREVRGKRAA